MKMTVSLIEVYLFSSMPRSLQCRYAANPQVRRLAATRSIEHLLTGYIVLASRPHTLYDVVRAYVYLVALRLAGYAKPVPRLLDWSGYL